MKIKLDKEITTRKWKAKEKKEFLRVIKSGESFDALQNVLVYNCLEEDVALSPDEFKYVMSRIRIESLGDDLGLEFYCDDCKTKFIKELKISDIIKPVYSGKKILKTPNYEVKISEIKNVQFYKQTIAENPEEEKDYDFYLRIESINDNDALTLNEIIEIFNEMDIDDFDSLFMQWEDSRFKVNDNVDICCSNCGGTVTYSFDEIPGFFPVNWFE